MKKNEEDREVKPSNKVTLLQKLLEVKKSIPYLKKDVHGYEYRYVSGAEVLSKINKKMNELGLLLVPKIMGEENRTETNAKGSIVYIVVLIMEMVFVDVDTGEAMPVPWIAYGKQNDPSKSGGSALTYYERYFYLKFFNIPTDNDDPDAFQRKMNEPPPPVPENEKPMTISKVQQDKLVALTEKLKITNAEAKEIINGYGFASSKDIETHKFAEIELSISSFGAKKQIITK